MDASMAAAIMGDAKFEVRLCTSVELRDKTEFGLGLQNDNDYMDDNVERLARKKMKNDAMKRAFAVNGQWNRSFACYTWS